VTVGLGLLTAAPGAEAQVRRKRTAPVAAHPVATQPAIAPPPVQITQPSSEAAAMLATINAARSAAGVGPLQWHPDLAGLAAAWNETMARTGLAHRPTSQLAVGLPLRRFAENVGWGDGFSWPAVLSGLFDSPAHRANLLSPAYTQVGLDVLVVRNEVFITQNFGGP
jgi:uncharacterized protein YkwD